MLLLHDYTLLGLVLCAVALADLCLVWLLRWWPRGSHGYPRPSRR